MFYIRKNDTVEQAIYELEGSCDSMNPEEFTEEELNEIDCSIFNCDNCGWWFSVGDDEEVEDVGQVCYMCFKYDFDGE